MIKKNVIHRERSSTALEHTLKPLNKYLHDPDVYEIRVNKFCQVVCDTIHGKRILEDQDITENYINKRLLPALVSDNKSEAKAINNLLLPDGSRAIILQSPAIVPGTVAVAIRKHMEINKSLEELAGEGRFDQIRARTFDEAQELADFERELLQLLHNKNYVDFLRMAVRTKRNIVVSGSTGSGKTVLTRALVGEIPKEERIILMEDVHEVSSTHHDEIVYLMYGEGRGRISPSECLKACMRLSPNRILMTELRDSAAWDFLVGTNTAHPGTIFSTHSDDAPSTPSRIADLVKSSEIGGHLDYNMILKRVNTTLDVIVYMENWNIVEVLYDPEHKKKLLMAV